jgi:hypothetical protein
MKVLFRLLELFASEPWENAILIPVGLIPTGSDQLNQALKEAVKAVEKESIKVKLTE